MITDEVFSFSVSTLANLINKFKNVKSSTDLAASLIESNTKSNSLLPSPSYGTLEVLQKEKFSYQLLLKNLPESFLSEAHNFNFLNNLLDNYFLELYYWFLKICLEELGQVLAIQGKIIESNDIFRLPIILQKYLAKLKVCCLLIFLYLLFHFKYYSYFILNAKIQKN